MNRVYDNLFLQISKGIKCYETNKNTRRRKIYFEKELKPSFIY